MNFNISNEERNFVKFIIENYNLRELIRAGKWKDFWDFLDEKDEEEDPDYICDIHTFKALFLSVCYITKIDCGLKHLWDFSEGWEKELYIPDCVEEIGPRAFCWCEQLEEIYIPNSVKKIGEDAFVFCGNLKKIAIPKHFHEVEPYAWGIKDVGTEVEIEYI